MVFASPAWGAEGTSAHLSSMKALEPVPSLGKGSSGQGEICAPLPTVDGCSGGPGPRTHASSPCLCAPAFSTPFLLRPESLLTCSPLFCPGWEQVQLAVILSRPFSLSLESHFIVTSRQDPLLKICSSHCLHPTLQILLPPFRPAPSAVIASPAPLPDLSEQGQSPH